MSFPNYPDKYYSPPVMLPEHALKVRKQFGRFPKIQPPESMIFCFDNRLPHRMRWKVPLQHVGRVFGDFYLVRHSRGRVAILNNFGIGAPAVVSLAEEMIAFGIRKFIILSWGGILQPDLRLSDIVVCDRAIRDEGTSYHYLPPEKYAYADEDLCNQIRMKFEERKLNYTIGTTWTTDAPYRETVDEVKKYQSEGVRTVEMESAGLFALGRAREVQTASVIIASDNLTSLSWQPPVSMKNIHASFDIAYSAIVDSLS